MNKSLEQVKEFHVLFNAPVLDLPQIPAKERCDLRISLISEELDELKEAIKNNDLVETLDALCDIMYVLNGTILEFGFQNIFDTAFNEVQRSNISKVCNSELEAQETIEHYKLKDGTDAYYKENNGKWLVYRKEDDKILKSINYIRAELNKIINE